VMGSFGPGGQKDLGRARDAKTIELLERGFAALPAAPAGPTSSAVRPLSPATEDVSPISRAPLSQEEKAPDAASDGEPVIKFTPPPKKK
jgi:hypothetical protein